MNPTASAAVPQCRSPVPFPSAVPQCRSPVREIDSQTSRSLPPVHKPQQQHHQNPCIPIFPANRPIDLLSIRFIVFLNIYYKHQYLLSIEIYEGLVRTLELTGYRAGIPVARERLHLEGKRGVLKESFETREWAAWRGVPLLAGQALAKRIGRPWAYWPGVARSGGVISWSSSCRRRS